MLNLAQNGSCSLSLCRYSGHLNFSRFGWVFCKAPNLLFQQILSPSGCCKLPSSCFSLSRILISHFCSKGFFLIFLSPSPPPLFFKAEQSRDSQSGFPDSPLFAEGSTKERPQTHPERCHSQRCVWGPCQQVHSTPASSCGRGQPQQVQVSTTVSLEAPKDVLSFYGSEKGNRKSIDVTRHMKENYQPFYNTKNFTH